MDLRESWSAISPESADTYLNYYPKFTKHLLAAWLKKKQIKKPRVLEVGCGNAIVYGEIKRSLEIQYTGVDFSLPLIEAGRRRFNNDPNCTLIHQNCFKFLDRYQGSKFDLIIIAHVFELVESQDRLLHLCAKHAKHIAIIWFEPPKHEFHTVEIKPSAHPKEESNAPYLRIKTGNHFYRMLLDKHKLTKVKTIRNPEQPNDVLHILDVN